HYGNFLKITTNPPFEPTTTVGFLLSIKTQKIGISIKISDSLLTNNIGNAIFISSTNKNRHRGQSLGGLHQMRR
ncbi:hypothetical protein ACHBZD_00825, partial [Acinetobacter baumannii]|uniref:hypothetical protein n=1 Tax=Acinetobacter baumannii TaxID=470 RepID=UPI003D12F9ED